MSSVLDWVSAQATQYGFDLTKVVARGISTGGYYALRVAHTHADRLLAVVAQGGGCHYMFDSAWIDASNQMEYPFALADALAYKFGYRGADPLSEYAAGALKFSLLDSAVLAKPNCKLLVLDGMEDSIFPIEDNFIVGLRGNKKDLVARETGNIWETPERRTSCIAGLTMRSPGGHDQPLLPILSNPWRSKRVIE